jgi:hypothetical protein
MVLVTFREWYMSSFLWNMKFCLLLIVNFKFDALWLIFIHCMTNFQVGLNNIKETDFVNVTIQSLMRVTPLRNFFLIPENYQHCKSPLVHRFGELTRKIWHARNFKGQVCFWCCYCVCVCVCVCGIYIYIFSILSLICISTGQPPWISTSSDES